MKKVLEDAAFINRLIPSGEICLASMNPVDREGKGADYLWEYCDVHHELVPMNGRYYGAKHDLQIEASKGEPDSAQTVGEAVTEAGFPFEASEINIGTWLKFVNEDGEVVFRYVQNDFELNDAIGEGTEYTHLELRLEHLETESPLNSGSSTEVEKQAYIEDYERKRHPHATYF